MLYRTGFGMTVQRSSGFGLGDGNLDYQDEGEAVENWHC